MGLLVEGRWHDQWYESGKDGAFQREQAQRRNWLTADGKPGPTGVGGFAAEVVITSTCPSPVHGLTAH
jgi:putative glutathione S-transferase